MLGNTFGDMLGSRRGVQTDRGSLASSYHSSCSGLLKITFYLKEGLGVRVRFLGSGFSKELELELESQATELELELES